MLEIIKFRRSSSEKITKTKCVLVASHSRDFLLLCVLEELSTHWLPQSAQHMNKHDEKKKGARNPSCVNAVRAAADENV